MFFNTLLLPDTITSWHGGPRFATQVQPSPSGDEARRATWPKELGSWELNILDLDPEEIIALFTAFLLTAGRAHGFRYHDQDDDTGTDVLLGIGDGTTTVVPLVKLYDEFDLTYSRPITRFVVGSVVVFLDGTPTTAFTIEEGTGLIWFVDAPEEDVEITADFLFHVPVRFDIDTMDVSAVDALASTWSTVRLVELREVLS